MKAAEDDLFEARRQCLSNVWFETVKLKPKTVKKLAPHSAHIKFAADKRNPIAHRRRRLVQKGEGSLPFSLTSVLFIVEHVKRLVLVPEHMVDQRKKPLVPPLTAQVQEIDSDLQDIMQRQDIPIEAQAKVYDQNLQSYPGFVRFHNLQNPGFSRTFSIIFPGVFEIYKTISQKELAGFSVFYAVIKI